MDRLVFFFNHNPYFVLGGYQSSSYRSAVTSNYDSGRFSDRLFSLRLVHKAQILLNPIVIVRDEAGNHLGNTIRGFQSRNQVLLFADVVFPLLS